MVSLLSDLESVRFGVVSSPDRFFRFYLVPPSLNKNGKKRSGDKTRFGAGRVNHLANPGAISSANVQIGFGGNEEEEKCVLYRVYQ